MAKYCSDCSYFDTNQSKNGCSGYCKCTKTGKYILANMSCCENFLSSCKSSYEKECLYDEAKKYEYSSKESESPMLYLFILIMLIALGLIVGI